MDTIALVISALGLSFVTGAVCSGWAWERHHRAVLRQCRDDHRRQMAALLGQQRAAFARQPWTLRTGRQAVVRGADRIGRN